jgi:hypothetical protein
VTAAGGLRIIGGGYGDADWLDREFAAAEDSRVGCGFITRSRAKQPELLTWWCSAPAALPDHQYNAQGLNSYQWLIS